MHAYRTHTCGQLRPEHVGQTVRLSGWVQRKRDHGGLLFIDLRDHYGITQVVFDTAAAEAFAGAEAVRTESVITVTGPVVARGASPVTPRRPTGAAEVRAGERGSVMVEGPPIPVCAESDITPEDLRLSIASSTPRQAALQHHAAQPGSPPAPVHDRAGLH